MAKRSRSHRPGRREESADKPDYAMDRMHEPKKLKETPEEKEARVSVGERIGQGALEKLQELRKQVEVAGSGTSSKAPANRQQESRESRGTAKSSVSRETSIDAEQESFADLFDPKSEAERDFADLLKDSKQDWREYK